MKVLVAKTFQFVDRIWLTYTRKRWLDSGYGKHRLLISFYTFIEDINYSILVRLRRRGRRERVTDEDDVMYDGLEVEEEEDE